MRLKIDQENDLLYFRLDETPIVESEEVSPGTILNEQDRLVGVEILGLSSRVPSDILRLLQFETT